MVYFTGVGCQVAGLRSFLLKDYPNLITSDLVCHGTPNQKLFDEHIAYLEKLYKGKAVDYQFRDNSKWGVYESVTIITGLHDTKIFKLPTYKFSPYLYSFMHAMTYRLSCYECPFAKVPRQGDITLADFWGAKKFTPELDSSKGVSLILVNTPKGEKIIKQIKGELTLVETNLKDAATYNPNLVRHTKMPEIRKDIFNIIREKGYDIVATTVFKPSNYIKLKILYKIIDIIGLERYTRIRNIFRKK